MAFKNAFKILIEKFGLVWKLMLFTVIIAVILISVSMAFMIPIYRALLNGGIIEQFTSLFTGIMNGESINTWFEMLRDIGQSFGALLRENLSLRINSALWLVFVVVFAYRFLLGFYELPLIAVLDASMSANARIGFTGQIVSKLGKSARFTLVKMLYTVVYDTLVVFITIGLFKLLDVPVLAMFAPFIIMTVFIALTAFRYTLIAMWAPRVIDGGKIFASFGFSVRSAFKNFGSIFAYFLVTWVLVITCNVFVGLFTLGAGLLISVPTSMLLVNILNMTLYYGKNGKRYYVDGSVITPPYKGSETAEQK